MTRKRGNLRWWIATVVGGLGVCLGVALGLWQLERAAQKNQLQQAMHAQATASPWQAGEAQEALVQSAGMPQLWLHHPVQLQGQWLAAYTVYLDNRQMQGHPGFFVLTPLQLADGSVVLVQRGWVPRNFEHRTLVPPIDTPPGTVEVLGQLAGSPGRLLALGAEGAAAQAQPDIRQNLDIHAFADATGLPLWPATVVQTGVASEGLLRDWPLPEHGIATHYGYAFQWFAIAAVLAAMLLWFQWWQPTRSARQRHAS